MKQVYTSVLDEAREQKNVVRTNQGGEAYRVNDLTQLRRFLILGTEGGSFYANERALTNLNIKAVQRLLDENGYLTVDEIVKVSVNALAPSNDPALLALSMAAAYKNSERSQYAAEVRNYALSKLNDVARTGTHLFTFVEYVTKQRGWGSSLRRAIANWYDKQNKEGSYLPLAHQVTKYAKRGGWSHADLLRLSHPQAKSSEQNAIFKYIVDGDVPLAPHFEQGYRTIPSFAYLGAVEAIKHADTTEAIKLIGDYNLPREVVPSPFLNDPNVWEALLYAGKGMPLMAMTRNLGTMSKIKFLTQGSQAARFVIDRLNNEEAIRYSKMHPIDMIKAKLQYQQGHGLRSDAVWTPVRGVTDALESGFYLTFPNVVPTNVPTLLALDVSGSMGGGMVANIPGFTPGLGTAVMSMVTARVEKDYEIVGFTHRLIDLDISKHDSLDTAMRKVIRSDWGGTDCRLPFQYAIDNKRHFEAFFVYTDNDTGRSNPARALREYRKFNGVPNAKLAVVSMVANDFSIADPEDRFMMDFVGFDASAPAIMSAFVREEI